MCTKREIKQSLSARKKMSIVLKKRLIGGHKTGDHGKNTKNRSVNRHKGDPIDEYNYPRPQVRTC